MESIKRFLRGMPSLYRILRKIYIPISRRYGSLVVHLNRNSLSQYLYVKRRPTGRDRIESWNSRLLGHRPVIVEKIAGFSPDSVLEVGCNVGEGLYLLAKKFPDMKISGIDINPLAVQMGNEMFEKEGISAWFNSG
jgi:SAM-dependent methyltransferase